MRDTFTGGHFVGAQTRLPPGSTLMSMAAMTPEMPELSNGIIDSRTGGEIACARRLS